ncbi:AAA family ATPase [Mycobacterium sp.]|uniref:AAA family ATPase n=1 Tax=Mycobacterium sp. TaxID=1785 RepID=UPI002C13411C|nr:AAA family ATPase [Mycobacterium sp.]HTY31032.1 AAA family ATPase [Mycobacterium sp.]
MDEGAVLPDRREFVPAETVRESTRSRVTRLFAAGPTVIRKEMLGSEAPRRLRHEGALLERLRGVVGVAQLLDEPRFPGSLTLADAGQTSLADLPKPLAPEDLIGVATALAEAVAAMHGRGVMHRDICPANIVISADGAPCLVSFGLAGSLAEIRPDFTHHNQIVGTLPYLAPEQTGRTGRPVDQRADLYALGATLYELATGRLPFDSQDPLRLTHDHLARMPEPPGDCNPSMPEALSAIIMHLLEKEPDDRYQSADGVIHDLRQIGETGAAPAPVPSVGGRDFPLRLMAPSRLIGRDDELVAMSTAFTGALTGRCRGVLVSGAPGVGKTALVDQLRPIVTGHDGWFVAGKFDQYRRDLESGGFFQAFRALGRLLLSEPEDSLIEIREKILAALGPNAGLAAAAVPEFSAALGVPAEAGDPLTAQVRMQHSAVSALRAVASRERPVVVFVDDVQWASGIAVGFIDLVLREGVEGLLLVGAHRDDIDPADPLSASVPRWREQPGVTHLQLLNLPASGVADLVAEILRVDRVAAGALADLVAAHTRGNPYETVELLNTLRQEGILSVTSTGWRWDDAAVRALMARSEATRFPLARLAALSARSREAVQVMACLGGRAELGVLAAAMAESTETVEQRLAPALEEGVLVAEIGAHDAVQFRHDRIREAILAEVDSELLRTLHLAAARRLAARPELFAIAAEQYLPVIGEVTDAGERSQTVQLLHRAAEQATLVGDYGQVHTLLSSALRIADPRDTAALIQLHTGRLTALFCLGRLEQADDDYRVIERLSADALQRVDATCVQVRSLTNRKLYSEALELAMTALRELGTAVPPPERLPELLERYFDYLYRWLDHTDDADDLRRPEVTDPSLLGVTCLFNAVFPTATFAGDMYLQAWLSLEALQIWLDHGTARGLVGPASYSAATAIAVRDDYGAAHRAARRIVALGEARGYEPESSLARFVSSYFGSWFEPLEVCVERAKQAGEGLIKGGDLATAGYTVAHTYGGRLDLVPTLDIYVAEAEKALSFVRRVGIDPMSQWVLAYQSLADALRGERSDPSERDAQTDVYAADSAVPFYGDLSQAIAAAIFNDAAGLRRHTAAAIEALPFALGNYVTAVARLLRGLALATEARTAGADERPGMLAELDGLIGWLQARARDAPMNFMHLLRLLEAERAWAAGDLGAAALAFDSARDEVAARQRPWHQALITERAALFAMARGLQHAGLELLVRARQQYLVWGATAKAHQLDQAYPALRQHAQTVGEIDSQRPGGLRGEASTLNTGTVDLLGILSASRALSSETTVEGLHARVVDVLAAMTGATAVRLLLCSDDGQAWSSPAMAVGTPGGRHAAPDSVLRYVERMREPLVVTDAASDDRFALDPYFADVDRCSLLALPILGRGRLRAVLLLENRLIRGAFTADRLDPVKLIAGQLAVSLDNARLYADVAASRARIVAAADQARRRIERDLHDGAQQQLVSLAMQLRVMREEVSPSAHELRSQLDRAITQATGALDELRELSRGIHPATLAKGGLGPALNALARRSPLPVALAVRVAERLPDQVEVSTYYTVAEVLTNAAKYSHAKTITVTVDHDAARGALRIEVVDDGVGGADFNGGTGLLGLKDRAEALGGQVELQSSPGAGTTVRVRFPVTRAKGDPSE